MRAFSVGFTGTQRGMSKPQEVHVRECLRRLDPSRVMHGGCIGADDRFDQIAHEMGIYRVIYPSNIVKKRVLRSVFEQVRPPCTVHEPLPPLYRNRVIVRGVSFLIACPGESEEVLRSGTWATIRYARGASRRMLIIDPEGNFLWNTEMPT